MDWPETLIHSAELNCLYCQAHRSHTRFNRVNRGNELTVCRCHQLQGFTICIVVPLFAGSQLMPQHVVLLQGVLQGKPSKQVVCKIGLSEAGQ